MAKKQPLHDYEEEMKYQQDFLKKQETEMGVAQNALDKYPTMGWLPTIILTLSALLGWSVTAYHVADSVLNKKNDTIQKTLPLTIPNKSLQDVLQLDTIQLIEQYKQTLDSDEREKFEQFSPQRQWDYIHNNQ